MSYTWFSGVTYVWPSEAGQSEGCGIDVAVVAVVGGVAVVPVDVEVETYVIEVGVVAVVAVLELDVPVLLLVLLLVVLVAVLLTELVLKVTEGQPWQMRRAESSWYIGLDGAPVTELLR